MGRDPHLLTSARARGLRWVGGLLSLLAAAVLASACATSLSRRAQSPAVRAALAAKPKEVHRKEAEAPPRPATGVPTAVRDRSALDPRLASAWIVRDLGREPPRASDKAEIARLQRHFDAVLERLEAQTPESLETALSREEAAEGGEWTPARRRRAYEQLARHRAEQIERLREYRDRGLFPLNESHPSGAVPIFVDAHDTACAVAYLMRRDGWQDAVAEIARTNDFVYLPDVKSGPFLAWVMDSGLTREEAALVQPAYAPPPLQATLDQLAQPGSSVGDGNVHYENFQLEIGPYTGGVPPNPAVVGAAARLGTYYSLDGGEFDPHAPDWLFLGGPDYGDFGITSVGDLLQTRVSFDAVVDEPQTAFDSVFLTSDPFIGGNYVGNVNPGTLTLTATVFDGNGEIGQISIGGPGGNAPYGSLDQTATLSFAPIRRVHVETTAVLQDQVSFSSVIHEFGLIPVPEPGTLWLASVGLLLMVGAARRPH